MATHEIPKRRLGRTNEFVSMVGLGGFHIGKPDIPDGDAIKLIHAAIDRGITFLDNSWDYNNGNSELRMGRALQVKGYRDKVFLMSTSSSSTRTSTTTTRTASSRPAAHSRRRSPRRRRGKRASSDSPATSRPDSTFT